MRPRDPVSNSIASVIEDYLFFLLPFISFILIMTKKMLKRKRKEDVEKEDEPKKKVADEPATKKVCK